MFRRLFIANRGEVAVRVARAARSLGISPVCAVSQSDRETPWASAMDEVVCLGPGNPELSYLRVEAAVQAALQTGCAALHPGWGFLAENARFAALCQQHGLTFIGPSPSLIDSMGLKWPSKQAARRAGLTLIPGSEGLLRDVDEALEVAARIGYPVMIKADAGGGGRGMRRCTNEEELRAGYAQASAEAMGAFGNGDLFLEKCLQNGRHIEVQILGDRWGKVLHLYERECSIQRKHQKLIEESPSPALDQQQREELGTAAAQAAAALGYVGAGTIEFLMDAESGDLHFMEMNTRLQVEHGISECITGVDIVREQIRVAAGEKLEQAQEDITVSGHAIECRINAEDPTRNFQPTPGDLTRFQVPRDLGPGSLRVDTHVQEGDTIPPHYDSLMAKLIAHGKDRAEALETMRRALDGLVIEGVTSTTPLHQAVLASGEFQSGAYNTGSIPGWTPQQVS
ncbi:MAG TPA: acetyl-CoA carboxylase biotin carboxylase subunit [Planctomycetes bacterium]|nr:acetyl-CoA carboxylase biotin carboxylase subunit [Planctomycetota bacterium]HIL37107.1 acetyl-CoA carboxylase biotin carboxylase subunit [Planctomycetota bacterium]